MTYWQHNADFRSFFSNLLAEAPFSAYFWETPPITTTTVSRLFEFVLVDCPSLVDTQADPRDFQTHFTTADASAKTTTFLNLGKDAMLVAPCPRAPLFAYPHLAAFSRLAPPSQQQALWRAIGTAVEDHLSPRSLWLSTSGLSVSWLHVRLDSQPKYYTFAPYRHV